MCPHIFFRLSLSSFLINTLKTNYLTSSSLTILTLCVIIFLKTVIIFISTIYALNFHWFHKTLYISEIQTHQSNLQIVTADFFAIPVIIFSPITTALIPRFCAANAIADRHFSPNEPPPQRAFSCHFQSGKPHCFMFLGSMVASIEHCLLCFWEHGCINPALFAVFWGPFLVSSEIWSDAFAL